MLLYSLTISSEANDIFNNPVIHASGTDGQQESIIINSKLHQTTIIVYISLSLSVILTVTFLLFAFGTLVVCCKFRQAKLESKSRSPHHAYNQPESVYEDMLDGNFKADARGIEMKTNIVYKRP